MKKLALLILFLIGLITTASAAITAGFEAGYLTDNKDAYWSGRAGWVFKADASLSHQVEIELGYTEHTETIFGSFKEKTKLTPLTINYRAETTAADKLGYYFGAGIGRSWVHASFPGVPVSGGDTAFAFQAFAGVNYKVTPAATLHLGAKFLRIDNVHMFASEIEVGNDTALTAGLSVKF